MKKRAGVWKVILGLLAFVSTGIGLFISTIQNETSLTKIGVLFIVGIFYIISLMEYSRDLINIYKEKPVRKKRHYVVICGYLAVIITWLLNHKLNLGPVISNGIVGVIAVFILPKDLAGISFTSSFVGMSSLEVLPNILSASLGGIVVGLVILATGEIYAGIGGKGGTTAALSTIVSKFIYGIFS